MTENKLFVIAKDLGGGYNLDLGFIVSSVTNFKNKINILTNGVTPCEV